MKKFESSRDFQLWSYTVSHGMLLIRSPGGAGEGTIDLVFHGLKYISVPRYLIGLSVDEGEWNESQFNFIKSSKISEKDLVFTLSSDGSSYYIVAAGVKMNEHDRDIFWDPFKDM
ncbi:hypothetical protein [Dyella sp. GSA-30]|uniref:hypothetical protein n=1 Tax=Dyella sp. GSA-30 TaxID=2994496 RepID=UPI0024929E7A|nr:hypothetical protein [Dyella sp. GSA-30]BDU22952.1 hypothetical protein DYGSA30_44090 [Dyella sp. GSA-30]